MNYFDVCFNNMEKRWVVFVSIDCKTESEAIKEAIRELKRREARLESNNTYRPY